MVEERVSSLVKRLLDAECLSCALCNEILQPPIMLIENIGNVCSTCFEEQNEFLKMKHIPNTALEKLFKLLKLPCKFNQKGCTEVLSYEELNVHHNSCHYRTKLCSMFKFEGCEWEGNTTDLINHFKICHSNHVINSENNIFILRTTWDKMNMVKLLVTHRHAYILRMQTNNNKNKFFYMICNINDEHSSFCEYTVKHKGGSENYIKTKSKILSSYNIYNDFDENIAVEIDLNALKQISHVKDSITNFIKIKFECSKNEGFDNNLLQFFECPVCKHFMKPPIYQCQLGHSICHRCKPRLDKCPTCRGIYSGSRNYSLEGLTNGLMYPCIFHDLGCPEMLGANMITKHERECSFRPYNCPFANCDTNGDIQTLTAHLSSVHSDNVIYSGATGYRDSFRLLQNSPYNNIVSKKCIVAYDHIFRLTCKRAPDQYLWAAEVVGSNSISNSFVYKVTIFDPRRSEKKLIRTDYCFGELGEDEIFKRCVMFPISVLNTYSTHGEVTFEFEVKQK